MINSVVCRSIKDGHGQAKVGVARQKFSGTPFSNFLGMGLQGRRGEWEGERGGDREEGNGRGNGEENGRGEGACRRTGLPLYPSPLISSL